MKIEIDIIDLVIGLWVLILGVPATLLMLKVAKYFYETPFKEWWFSILWVMIIPITTIVVFTKRK